MTLQYISDEGHGWLVVTASTLAAVGLTENDISPYSYKWGELIGLEEDCDLPRFLTAYHKRQGRLPTIIEGRGSCRGWKAFGKRTGDAFGGIDFKLLREASAA